MTSYKSLALTATHPCLLLQRCLLHFLFPLDLICDSWDTISESPVDFMGILCSLGKVRNQLPILLLNSETSPNNLQCYEEKGAS